MFKRGFQLLGIATRSFRAAWLGFGACLASAYQTRGDLASFSMNATGESITSESKVQTMTDKPFGVNSVKSPLVEEVERLSPTKGFRASQRRGSSNKLHERLDRSRIKVIPLASFAIARMVERAERWRHAEGGESGGHVAT
jgi:hypothetical protein